MALNLKTLATRSLSAAVFVLVLVGAVYWNAWSFAGFFLIVSLIGTAEFSRLTKASGFQKTGLLPYLAAALVYLAALPAGLLRLEKDLLLPVLACCFLLFLCLPLFSARLAFRDALVSAAGLLYSVLPFALLNRIAWPDDFSPNTVMAVILLIWANDTFAYLGGSLFGRNKMIERISPGKTWEGTITGIVLSFGLSLVLPKLLQLPHAQIWPALGIVIPVLATLGDLAESKIKREAGLKDSGSVMPGHGGVLDRFDSLIFVSPFVYLFLSLL